MAELDHIVSEFLDGAGHLLQSAESGLLQMESGEMGDQAAQTVFRAIHAIKGGAALAGLEKIQRLARQMEGLLDLCRNGDLQPAQTVTDSLLQALDTLASLCDRVEEHESIDIQGSASAMEAALNTELEPAFIQSTNKVDTDRMPGGLPVFEISEYCLEQKRRQGNLYYIRLDLAQIKERGLTPIQLLGELTSMGEVIDSIPNLPSDDVAEASDAAISFDILYASALEQDLLQAALRLDQESLRLLTWGDSTADQAPAPGIPLQSAPPEAPAPEPEQLPDPQPPPSKPPEAEPVIQPAGAAPQPALSQDRTAFSNLEAPAESDDDTEGYEFLTFTLGAENYGVDILSVQEIIALPRLTKLPRAPRHVLGVMNLRGMVVPVLDLRLRLNLPCGDEIEPVVVVMQIGRKFMGAVVDSVSDVVVFKESEIQDPPDFAVAVHREYLRGLCRHNDDLIVILELDQMLAPEAKSNVP